MKAKPYSSTFIALCMACMPFAASMAQKPAAAPALTADELMAAYRFDEAFKKYDAEAKRLKARRQVSAPQEAAAAQCRTLQFALEAAQQVTFVDSVVVPFADFVQRIPIGPESGKLTTWTRAFGGRDTLGCTVYQSQLANLTILAAPTKGAPRLCRRWAEEEEGADTTPLVGLNTADTHQNYPFMMSDGVTFYYGAINPAGYGGYDIYFSRLDSESGSFSQPENMGMPFNSSANDYMLAIDEYNNLGYLVTDRRQPAGKVCIYTFIPPTVRTSLADLGTPIEEQRSLAALRSIAATQKGNAKEAKAAKARHKEALEAHVSRGMNTEETTKWRPLVLAGDIVARRLEDVPAALQSKALAWQEATQQVEEARVQLETTRQLYAQQTRQDQKARLRTQILTMETALEQSEAELKQLEKEIRK